MLQDLKRDILNGKTNLADAITSALPTFHGKLSEAKISFLVSEYQGYGQIALDYYKRPNKEFPSYRIVEGELKMMMVSDGSLTDVNHPLAAKQQFFVAGPIAWIEESANLPIDPTMIEMAEMGRMPTGIIVCVTAKANAQRVIDVVRQSLLSFIDESTV